MTAEELATFIAEVRAEADERLAILHAVDPDTLPRKLRGEYVEALEAWRALRALTDDEAVELHLAACLEADRELTPAEARALIVRQCPPPACPAFGKPVGGFCWYTGAGSCDTICAAASLTYDPATETYAGSGGTASNCTAVAAAFRLDYSIAEDVDCTAGPNPQSGIGCVQFGSTTYRCIAPPTTASAAPSAGERYCACQ